jgi:hypothetical protein
VSGLALYLGIQTIQIIEFRGVALYGCDAVTDKLGRSIELFLSATGDENLGALRRKL